MQSLNRIVLSAAIALLAATGCGTGQASNFEATQIPAQPSQLNRDAPNRPFQAGDPAPTTGAPSATTPAEAPPAGTTPAGETPPATTPPAETPPASTPPASTPPAANVVGVAVPAEVMMTVDTTAEQKPISRFIYGKNFNGSTWEAQPHLTMQRIGGNRWTAYNWEINASNAGSDYNHISDGYLGGGDTAGEAVRAPVAKSQQFNGATLVTVPIAGYVAADKLGTSTQGQAVASRYKQIKSSKGSAPVYPPVTTDEFVYEDEFVSWLESQFPGVHGTQKDIFYSLDNEPDLWSSTHSVMHPAKATYAELLAKNIEYATMIKSIAPASTTFGFVSYGFQGFKTLQDAPDAAGRDFTDFYLDGAKAAETAAGKRLIDVLDLHWYPEATGGGTRIFGEDTSDAVANARMQAPRSLWDPSYVETSWISAALGNTAIGLVPSMQAKIAAHYPGTKLAFTEYYYGGGAHISGAIAQADVLGIFGKQGVFAASLWPMSSNVSMIDAAFRMFRNVDGAGTNFGDTSVKADSSDVATATVYASTNTADGKVTMVLVNKANVAKTTSVGLTHTSALGTAAVYQLTAGSTSPTKLADIAATQPNSFSLSLPPMSVTTLVFGS